MKRYFLAVALFGALSYWVYQAEERVTQLEAQLSQVVPRVQAVELRVEAIDLKADRTMEIARVTELSVQQTLRSAEEAIEANQRLMRELQGLRSQLRARKPSHEEEVDLDEEDPYHG
jgi:hypothetical protein